MNGKLFVIDGIDGSGKNTQALELYNHFLTEGYCAGKDIAMVSFPRYGYPSAKFVEMYLHGKLSANPMDIDPYTAAMFYTIDRSISFKTEKWGEVYRNGGIVIADRYYTSNIIHQGAKILSIKDKYDGFQKFYMFVNWIKDLETNKLGLPRPNKVIWLMTDKDTNDNMMKHRVETDASHVTDIHESNTTYLDWCREALQHYQKYFHDSQDEVFINVKDKNGEIRSIMDIHSEIYNFITKYYRI